MYPPQNSDLYLFILDMNRRLSNISNYDDIIKKFENGINDMVCTVNHNNRQLISDIQEIKCALNNLSHRVCNIEQQIKPINHNFKKQSEQKSHNKNYLKLSSKAVTNNELTIEEELALEGANFEDIDAKPIQSKSESNNNNTVHLFDPELFNLINK